MFVEIFGDKGVHARTALGVNALPRGVAVEVDAIVEVEGAPPIAVTSLPPQIREDQDTKKPTIGDCAVLVGHSGRSWEVSSVTTMLFNIARIRPQPHLQPLHDPRHALFQLSLPER